MSPHPFQYSPLKRARDNFFLAFLLLRAVLAILLVATQEINF